MFLRHFTHSAVLLPLGLVLGTGGVLVGAGVATDLRWLRLAGAAIVVAALGLFVLGCLGSRPIGQSCVQHQNRCQEAETCQFGSASAAAAVERSYRVYVARTARGTADLSDLAKPVNRLVRELRRIGGPRFTLCHADRLGNVQRIRWFWSSRAACCADSQVQCAADYTPSATTHELLACTRFDDVFSVYLWIGLVPDGTNPPYPGLIAELRQAPRAAERIDAASAYRIKQVRKLLVESLAVDLSLVLLPREPAETSWCPGALAAASL